MPTSIQRPSVVVLEHAAGVPQQLVSMLQQHANVAVSSDRTAVTEADGLVFASDAGYGATLHALEAVRGGELIGRRLAGGRPVLALGIGMALLFESAVVDGEEVEGLGEWPGVAHPMGEADFGILPVTADSHSRLFADLDGAALSFESGLAAQGWEIDPHPRIAPAALTWAGVGERWLAGVENGPLWAAGCEVHRSGPAGEQLLEHWLAALGGGHA